MSFSLGLLRIFNFGSLDGREIALYIGVAVVLLLAVRSVGGMFFKRRDPSFMVAGRCLSCRWQGAVSKYKPVCPRCRAEVQLARLEE